jgi:hypothetical protein
MTLFYSILAIIFVAFLSGAVIYVNRLKAKERDLGITGAAIDSNSGIAAATNALAKEGQRRT